MRLWDDKIAAEWETWENSRQGRFALEQKRKMLMALCAAWPRKKTSILEIGCCTGYFLQAFQEAGFQITGVDASPAMLKKARGRLGRKADLHLGAPEYLPFEDKAYDYILLSNALDFSNDPRTVLDEAFRVGKYGMALCFVNRRSCSCLSRYFRGNKALVFKRRPVTPNSWTWPEIRGMINDQIHQARMSRASVLPGPVWTWHHGVFGRLLNSPVYPLACGTYCAVRVDYPRQRPLTPLLAWSKDLKIAYPKANTLTSDVFKRPSCSAGILTRPSAWSMVFNSPDLPKTGTARGRSPGEDGSSRTRT
jgi:SAM-dependent methyltransferase